MATTDGGARPTGPGEVGGAGAADSAATVVNAGRWDRDVCAEARVVARALEDPRPQLTLRARVLVLVAGGALEYVHGLTYRLEHLAGVTA